MTVIVWFTAECLQIPFKRTVGDACPYNFRLFACHTIQVGEGTFRLAEITPPAEYPRMPFKRAGMLRVPMRRSFDSAFGYAQDDS